ncbi:MAG: site-specific integrase, partial [Nitrospirae bacterium]|nr:site-specific integrase [Nitrospirota bacterium]
DTALEVVKRNVNGKLPDAFLFINPRSNRHYTTKRLQKIWEKYSGLDITHYEAARHSFISQLVESDTNPLVTQKLARHSDIRTTMGYYHASAGKLLSVVNSRGKVVEIKKVKAEGEG